MEYSDRTIYFQSLWRPLVIVPIRKKDNVYVFQAKFIECFLYQFSVLIMYRHL